MLAVVHPTYAIFLWLPFAGFLVVRSLVQRDESRRIATALAALVVPAAAFLVWLVPVVRDTASHGPAKGELQRAFRQYEGQLDVFSDASYRLAPEVFGRAGAVAVAALLFVPLAGLALRQRWAAYVLGGFLAVAAVMLVPRLFVPFSDLVSISQARRAAGFWPLAFAFAGGLTVLAALLRWVLLPVALVAGIALQLAYPGEFDYRLEHGGPALVTWFAVVGGVIALVLGLVLLRRGHSFDRPTKLVAAAAVLFVLPIAVHSAFNWSPSEARPAEPADAGSDRRAAGGSPEGRRRLLGHRDELSDRRLRARVHRRRAAHPRRGHRAEPALPAARRHCALLRDRRPVDSPARRARVGSSSIEAATT